MNLKNNNRKKMQKILVLMVLFTSLFLISFPRNNNFVFYEPEFSQENILNEQPETNDLSSENIFTGIGAPWNVTHYGNRTKSDLAVSFNNNSYDDTHAQVELYGWDGYQLDSSISNLYDTRNWVNGTFHAGSFGGSPSGSDDSEYLVNWTFIDGDIGPNNNPMSGNYFDTSSSNSDGQDCLELRIDSDYGDYDIGDECSWETSVDLDRGNVEEAWLSFSTRAFYSDGYNNHMVLQVLVNDKVLWGNGLASILEASGNPSTPQWGDWYKPPIILLDVNDEDIFPTGEKNLNITFQFKRVSGTASGYADYYTVLFDNVSLIVKAEAKPTHLELQLNNEYVNDGSNYGEGDLSVVGNWNGSIQSSVVANFSSNANWPLTYDDDGNIISYKIELETELNLFATKLTPESYYTADPSIEFQGSSFSSSNISDTSWTTYALMEVPAGYEETNMTVEFPSDYSLTGVFFSLNPNSISNTSITEYGSKKVVNIPVSSITSNTNGFWRLTAISPNYCEELNIYNNNTGKWELDTQFLSGEYLNVTAKINNSFSYIQQTTAQLQIRFPNGTVWTEQSQWQFIETTGWVYFDPIRIPSDSPFYAVGEYEAIITWNNTYSSFGLNESGVIYKKFTVIHDSLLYPDQGTFFIDNVLEDRIINIKVSFNDLIDNTAIDYALVYTNFTGTVETFDRISPGFYLYEFNASKANPGNNTVTIYANHSLYLNKAIDITVYVIAQTTLTAEEYPSLEVTWNNNFIVHLNYTYESNGTGIENADLTIEWNGEKSLMSGNGLYNLTLNSSLYQINKVYNLRITFNKIGHEEQIMIISIGIVPRETEIASILINGIDCTANKSYNIRSGQLLDFIITYNDLEASGSFIKGALVTLNKTTEIGEIFDENPTYYNLTLDSIYLGVGTSFINIIATKTNYTSTIVLLTINVYERSTDYKIYLDEEDYTTNPAITTYPDLSINLTVSYIDTITSLFISGATVDVNGSGVSKELLESNNNYTTLLDTSKLNFGINFLTIYARKEGYEPKSITLAVQIIQIETELTLYLNNQNKTSNPAMTTYPNQFINLTVSYKEWVSKLFISGATVDVNGSGVSKELLESNNNYTTLIDTSTLNFGANFLTVYARKEGYEPQTIIITVQIIQIETHLSLYLDNQNKTSNPAITTYPNQIINLTVSYKEWVSTLFISGATVDVNGSGVSKELLESYGNYTTLLDTSKLNFGANFLTVYARKEGYEPQSIIITIQIIQIETELSLYLNNENRTLNPAITTYTDQLINLTVSYKEWVSTLFINGAIVDVNGSGVSKELIESYSNYTVMLNTSELNFGPNFLTVYARKEGYEPQTILITIQIIQIETELNLYLNNEDKTLNPSITTCTNQLINLTVSYKEWVSTLFINGATVDVNGSGVSKELIESNNNYTVMLNTTNFSLGPNYLTIYARKQGYEPQSIIFTIQMIEINTNYHLFLNDTNKTLDKSIKVTIGEFVNITLIYEDISGTFLDNATVIILGEGISLNLTKHSIYDQYYVLLNSNDLNFGINRLTLYAHQDNYQQQTFIVNIEIIDKDTDLHIYMEYDGETYNKTIDKTLSITIRKSLNITVNYFDIETGIAVEGATVQLVGTALSLNFSESPFNHQYSLIVNTSQIGLGVKFLTIYCSRPNYQSYSALFKIDVKTIIMNVSTMTGKTVFNLDPRDDFRLKIQLTDLAFNTSVLNATVRYTWAFGQGYLTDEDNDGIYEALLTELPIGTYIISITIYAGDDYEFTHFQVTMNIIPPAEDVLLFQILTIVGITAAIGVSGYLIAYQKFLKYPKQVRMIHKYKSKLKKKKPLTLETSTREEIIQKHYSEEINALEKQIKRKLTPKSDITKTADEIFEKTEKSELNSP